MNLIYSNTAIADALLPELQATGDIKNQYNHRVHIRPLGSQLTTAKDVASVHPALSLSLTSKA